MTKKKKFKKIYFIIQTSPTFSKCGYSFDRKSAEIIAENLKEVTGAKGRVVEFTREEIKGLCY